MQTRAILSGVLALAVGVAVLGLQGAEGPEKDIQPNGKGIGTIQHPPTPDQAANPQAKGGGGHGGGGGGGGKTKSNGIDYHGGPVMPNVHMYYIWYGAWTDDTAKSILVNLAQNIGQSSYYRINTTYYSSSNGQVTPVTQNVTFGGAIAMTDYPRGKSLSDSAIQQVVADAIGTAGWGGSGGDEEGVYFVLTSADVTATSGFCTVYCGWHTAANMTLGGTQKAIKYAFIGDPNRCLSACAAQSTSPNGRPGADAMASIIAHELEESASDPLLNAWYDRRGYENADKCAWKFGTMYLSNGAWANMNLGGLDYLIQQNWVNANGGYCAVSY